MCRYVDAVNTVSVHNRGDAEFASRRKDNSNNNPNPAPVPAPAPLPTSPDASS